MSITYIWKIEEMERDTASGAVTVVHWRCSGVDDSSGVEAGSYGSLNLPPADVDSDGFVAFEGLTESAVLKWVWDIDDHKSIIEQNIADQIDAVLNPTISKGMPW